MSAGSSLHQDMKRSWCAWTFSPPALLLSSLPNLLGLSPCSSCSTDSSLSAPADPPRAIKGLLVEKETFSWWERGLPWTKLQDLTGLVPTTKPVPSSALQTQPLTPSAAAPHHSWGNLGLHQGFEGKHQLRQQSLASFLGKKWRNGGDPRR